MQIPKLSCWGLMLDQENSDAKRDNAELLRWVGTAYGRRDAKSRPRANASAAFHLNQLAQHKRGGIAVLIVLLTVSVMTLVQVQASARFLGFTWTEKTKQMVAPQAPEAAQPSKDVDQRIELERAAHEARAQLAREHEARVALEAQVGQLVSDLAAQTRDRETAERASADTSVQLVAEQKARVDAEEFAKASKEALTHIESGAAAAAVTLPRVPQEAQIEQSWEETARVVNASVNAAGNSDEASSALLQGEKLLAKGDLEAARQRFEQSAKMGMPEGALALGNTYDPISLAKAGLNLTGDPTRARQSYRRALELAQNQKERRQ
jgi:hypothetical protein